MKIPLRNRAGDVVAEALLDDVDADLAQHRWHRSSLQPNGSYYAKRTTSRQLGAQRAVGMHVDVLARMGHDPETYDVADHVNGDTLDNRRENLRPATFAQNAENRRDHGRQTGRPRTLMDHPPRDCDECGATFVPRRKAAAANARFCTKLCQRRWQATENRKAMVG